MTLWTLLGLVIFGIALFEFGSRIITQLEEKGDFGSPVYLACLSIVTVGLGLAVASILEIYTRVAPTVKPALYSVTFYSE